MYIVIFNLSYRDPELLTNMHGFVEEFSNIEQAKEAAEQWIDGDQYRSYDIYKSEK